MLLIPKRHRRTDGRLTIALPRSALASRGKNCYLSFANPYKTKDTILDEDEIAKVSMLKNNFTEDFLTLIERKVIKDKEAYLMTDLLEDIADLSTENGLPESCINPVSNTLMT